MNLTTSTNSFCSLLLAFVSILSSADADTFTIVAIPDPQNYCGDTVTQPASSELFRNEMQWIANSIVSKNIVFVTHEGDMVNVITRSSQTDRAVYAVGPLKNTVPLSIVPGNHDYDSTATTLQGSTIWNTHFGPASTFFAGKGWFGGFAADGSDTDGMSTYQTFTAAGVNFLHIGLEIEPSDSRLAWASAVCDAHPGWPTIVTIHEWMTSGGGSLYGVAGHRDPLARNSSTEIMDEFILLHPQIFMVLCGHSFSEDYGCSYRTTDTNTAGYTVHQLLADYQGTYSGSGLGGGGGWIRLMEVNTSSNTIRVRTYSTIINKYSDDSTLTNGSAYARQWAAFNYDGLGEGSLRYEDEPQSSTFTIPFLYGTLLSRPAETYGPNLVGLTKSFSISLDGTWNASGLAFDPTLKVDGDYDRVYYVNMVSTGTQGLYAASLADETSGPRLALDTSTNPIGCTTDTEGNVYVCYNGTPAVWKIIDPEGSASAQQLIGNYRGTGDDSIQSIMMVPCGFGGGFDEGIDLVMMDSGIDTSTNEAVVVLDSASTPEAPLYTVLWEDTGGYFGSDINGAASDIDGYTYLAQKTIQFGSAAGAIRPCIYRIKPGSAQTIYLDTDITRNKAAINCDDAIAVNPANGSVWLATAASSYEGSTYPRTVWRIDVQNAVSIGTNVLLASVIEEIKNAYINIGENGMAWSPDGKYLAISCVDSDKLYIYEAKKPAGCADAIAKGYGLAYDFNDDCKVNLVDFASINVDQLAGFAIQWLECIDPQTCNWIWPTN